MSTYKHLHVERHSTAYWTVTIDNPPINLIDGQTGTDFETLLEEITAAPELKVLVLDSANPEFFIAHFDPAGDNESLPGPPVNGVSSFVNFATQLGEIPVVTIAKVRGRARGVGSEVALAADIRFASREKAIFSQIEVGVGLIPGGGAIERLPRLTGRGRALEIILGADDFDADLAEKYGWINRAIPDAELDDFVDGFARRVATFDKQAIGEAKRLVNEHSDTPRPEQLEETFQTFFAALQWEGAAARVPAQYENGAGQYSDLELNFGRRLGELGSTNK